jgi:hypothetical protein
VTPESAGSSLASTPEEEKARTALIVGACSTSANVTTVAPSRPPPKHQPTSRSRAHRDSRGCGRAACGGGKHRRSSGDTVLTLGLQEGNAKRCGDRASIQYCVPGIPGIRNPTRLQLPNDVRVPELRVRSREFLDAVLISGASRSQCGTLLRSCFASLPCPGVPTGSRPARLSALLADPKDAACIACEHVEHRHAKFAPRLGRLQLAQQSMKDPHELHADVENPCPQDQTDNGDCHH